MASSDSHAILPAEYTFTSDDAGVHTLSVTLDTAGTQSITAEDVAETTTRRHAIGHRRRPRGGGHPRALGLPDDRGGGGQDFTVTALDPFGNTATGYTGTIRFESSDRQATARSRPSVRLHVHDRTRQTITVCMSSAPRSRRRERSRSWRRTPSTTRSLVRRPESS